MRPISSVSSPRIQAVRRLHRRSARAAAGRFVVEGPQAVREALDDLIELYVLDPTHPLAVAALDRGADVVVVEQRVLDALAETVTPQGLVGVCPLLTATLQDALAPVVRLVAVLHQVSDPGNAGTVIRTSDACGADAVVLTEGSVDQHNGKCVRATAGSLWHLPVASGVAIDEAIEGLRGAGLQILGATGSGDADLDDLAAAGALAAPTAWLFGNEGAGLPANVLARVDRTVRIPLHGRAESLNLATAAAVCLYASARAQRALQ